MQWPFNQLINQLSKSCMAPSDNYAVDAGHANHGQTAQLLITVKIHVGGSLKRI